MSDRTSPEIFQKIFDLLAKNPTEDHKEIARKLWPSRLEYDFRDDDLGCDEALIALGLATRRGTEMRYRA